MPVAPQPRPPTAISGRLNQDGITISWNPPTRYTPDKTLNLKDIQYFTILRQTDTPVTNRWEFSETTEGWSEAGKTLPLKCYKGILRTASEHSYLIINSPEDLGLEADENRYIRFTLWARNCQQGYVIFITDQDDTWDTDFDRRFHPSVHTSYYSFQQVFKSVKVKPFRVISTPPNVAHEYVIDMHTLPTWTGKIQQIGIVLENNQPPDENDTAQAAEQENVSSDDLALSDNLLEAGVDNIEFSETFEQALSQYEAPPWVFIDDTEGWTSQYSDQTFGALDGVLYAEGHDTIVLLSQAGQRIQANDVKQIVLRMNVTEGQEAYLLFKEGAHDSFPNFDDVSVQDSPQAVRIPLQHHGQFHTYTIDMNRYVELLSSSFSRKKPSALRENDHTEAQDLPARELPIIEISQLALVFPALQAGHHRQIAIDYIDVVPKMSSPLLLTQHDLPSLQTLANTIRTKRLTEHLDFDISYTELPEEEEQTPNTQITLIEISPRDPFPATIEDNTFSLRDTGTFKVKAGKNDAETTAALEYGNRYTYQVRVTDRKKRESELSSSVTVDFVRPPTPPRNVSASPGDERITLNWDRPIFTVDGKKIRELTGYQVFRSQTPAEYLKTSPNEPETNPVLTETPTVEEPRPDLLTVAPKTLIATLPADQTHFTDKGLQNGRKHYYTIVTRTSKNSNFGMSEHSEEVVAVPVDNSPPARPTDLVGVYLHNTVNLYWKQNSKKDFGGFHIYRSDSAAGPFQKLNTEAVLKASYEDETVAANKHYYYQITAIDDELPPNESLPSEMTLVETFPLD